MDTYGQQIMPDPQDLQDENPCVCKCGELKRPDDEFCPSCENDYLDSIRKAAEMDRAIDLVSTLEDITYALRRYL